jgi:hypothetical protein
MYRYAMTAIRHSWIHSTAPGSSWDVLGTQRVHRIHAQLRPGYCLHETSMASGMGSDRDILEELSHDFIA